MLIWHSLDSWLVILLSIGYLAGLFVVARYGAGQAPERWTCRPLIYSLALAVSCTSWAFYGLVGQAAHSGAFLSPVYLGSIACMVLLWPILVKILRITKRQNLTSIADFIACRYERSPKVATLVTLVSLAGSVPYIALQLRAVTTTFELLTGTWHTGAYTTLAVTVVLAVFSILFGTRQIEASRQNQGVMLAIAFSSVVKLVAFLLVGAFVTYGMFDGFVDLLSRQKSVIPVEQGSAVYDVFAQVLLGALTIFVLPRQFHMMMIENRHEQELKKARWMYPGYLLLINLFVLPIAIAGLVTFPNNLVSADTLVLTLPLYADQTALAVVAYLGGLAAATSMVIVSTIVLSTMLGNEILNPLVIKHKLFGSDDMVGQSRLLRAIRRWSIVLILLLSYVFERLIGQKSQLAEIGLLSFVLLVQFAPLILAALYWSRATTKAALAGLLVGSCLWAYTLLLPTLAPHGSWVESGPLSIAWLKPTGVFGFDGLSPITHGLLVSLLGNILCFAWVALMGKPSESERKFAQVFLDPKLRQISRRLRFCDVQQLLQRFVEPKQQVALLSPYYPIEDLSLRAPDELLEATSLALSGVLGSASAKMVMQAAGDHSADQLDHVTNIVTEANEVLRFNRELLHATVEHIEQGISVVDADMRLVAWNQRYIDLFNYPDNVIYVGVPIEKLLRYNAANGVIECDDVDEMIHRRLSFMRSGQPHRNERVLSTGVVLEIRGRPMPGGGFVTTFSDITAHVKAEEQLQQTNELLEKRVLSRTRQLAQAKAEAERANHSKTRFLAAASHDLMQPFNALGLFTSMLQQKVKGSDLETLADHINDSLVAADALLNDLVAISKLDGGGQTAQCAPFELGEILKPLTREFAAISDKAGVTFRYRYHAVWLNSDKSMLRRIIQNFLSNAVRYCDKGKVLLGVRRRGDKVRIEVWDNGPGIAEHKQGLIFNEFERLDRTSDSAGLGLGLAICKRMAQLLELEIKLYSKPGKGSCFAVELPTIAAQDKEQIPGPMAFDETGLGQSQRILVIDNDPLVLTAMCELIEGWGFAVLSAKNEQEARAHLVDGAADIILADYHLQDACGVEVAQSLLTIDENQSTPVIINSADHSESVRAHTIGAGFSFIGKPVKAIALKRLIRRFVGQD